MMVSRVAWRGSCTFRFALLMRAMRTALARSGRNGAHDDAAGDAVAGIARRLAHVIVGSCVHDDGGAVAIEDRLLAVAQREGVADHARAQRAVGACELVGQI